MVQKAIKPFPNKPILMLNEFSGGNTETAYKYVMKNGGLETSSSYPYTSYYGTTGTCKSDSSKAVVRETVGLP